MHPYVVESLVHERIAELRGARHHPSAQILRASAMAPRRRSLRSRSPRWASISRERVGMWFVRVGLALIADGVLQQARHQSRQSSHPAPASIAR